MSRVFTLEEAKALMPQVKATTGPVFELATSLAQELGDAEREGDETRAEELRERVQALVESWAEAIRDLGPDVKGLWLVDFDSGDGYWCWAYPEEELEHWHSYEAGFSGRMPIEAKPPAIRS
ncbi:MAG: DUF2203 domain-containing protein [Acidobacteria bacterium]|nr:DUF2203 domain-containing protein [Acidobacteriota bacterium]